MRIGVLSDVHDNLPSLEAALDVFRARDIDTLLFLGDFCSPIPARVLNAYPGTVHCVFGNGDGDRLAIGRIAGEGDGALRVHGEWAELELGDRPVALTHYPIYGRALAHTGDYAAVFSGHTHERHEERFGDTLWVNPGEVLGWKGRASVAVWDTEANAVEPIELIVGPR